MTSDVHCATHQAKGPNASCYAYCKCRCDGCTEAKRVRDVQWRAVRRRLYPQATDKVDAAKAKQALQHAHQQGYSDRQLADAAGSRPALTGWWCGRCSCGCATAVPPTTGSPASCRCTRRTCGSCAPAVTSSPPGRPPTASAGSVTMCSPAGSCRPATAPTRAWKERADERRGPAARGQRPRGHLRPEHRLVWQLDVCPLPPGPPRAGAVTMTEQTLPLVDVHQPCPGYPCPQVRDGHGHDHTHTEVHLDGGCNRVHEGGGRRGTVDEITCPECRIHWRLHGAGQPRLDTEGA